MPKRDNGGVWVATEVRRPKREAYRTVDDVEIRYASDTVGMDFQRRHRRCVDSGEKVLETLPESLQARNRDEYGSEAEFLEARDLNFLQMAVLNYVREELIAEQPVPAFFTDEIRGLKIEPRAVTTQILKDKVVALLDAASGTSGTSGNTSRGRPSA